MVARAIGIKTLEKSTPLMLGQMIFGRESRGLLPGAIGIFWYLLNGVVLGIIFYYLAAAGIIFKLTVGSAIVFGIILWLLFNLLFLPITGQGIFGSRTQKGILIVGAASLIAYAVYGFSLGYFLSVLL
ncbi:MAG: hypothetical protein A3A16_02405 [Candidatus Harrisonbacteria bacterium RIFCSPLOWO2_01_FULL_44_18]|uniref:Uncharacterized protein n=1 Tax=Candidatus Harrisonbacteria bacterium RIFCSPLOWO2_01_FULL_44_18 TaxID=1798407 RepID=A0A1G1ZNB1_9BACT|nr:MAG: hypothetical protein A3A16_02405 [Candidatus Harrisonbacteria bacterium RIFCSPLOWO2_01_FULL_44_18]